MAPAKTTGSIGPRVVQAVLLIKSSSGFTLVELVIIVVVLGIIATVAIPRIGAIVGTSKTNATKDEMQRLKTALVGSAGDDIRGYENDVGSLPPDLTGLVVKPGGVSDWDRFTQTGWDGPYISADDDKYLQDAWGANYVYSQGSRTIKSVGSGDTLTVSF
ncbi:MAG: type II secretion system protein GspG [Candidatus Zixiibacteriota bacterium]